MATPRTKFSAPHPPTPTSSYGGSGNTYLKAFDGDVNTYLDASDLDGNWIQLDLGSQPTLTQIAFTPRPGLENRMISGVFEASNDPTFKTLGDIFYAVPNAPSDGLNFVNVSGSYRYVRYQSPVGSHGNIAEMPVFGISSATWLNDRYFQQTPPANPNGTDSLVSVFES